MRFNGLLEYEKQLIIISLHARKNCAYRALSEKNVEKWRQKALGDEVEILENLITELLASKQPI